MHVAEWGGGGGVWGMGRDQRPGSNNKIAAGKQVAARWLQQRCTDSLLSADAHEALGDPQDQVEEV